LFDVILDYIKKILKSRLLPITLVYIALFSVIIHQLFVLQIVQGPTHAVKNELKYSNSREIKSTRGNIYDRNGYLLASNVLTYAVTMEDSTKISSNDERNEIIHKLIQIIEKSGDTLDNPFYIVQNKNGEFEFTVKGSALARFKKNAYAYVLDDNKQLTEKQQNATAEEVYEFLRNGTGYSNITPMFGISDQYTTEETLKIMGIRYALFCNYPKYLRITVASKVNDKTVAAVKENSSELLGVEIQQKNYRVYNDSVYFAHILGYTGLVSADELEKLDDGTGYYNSTDIIGKSGLEQKYEEYLGGKKGSELVTLNASGKVINVVDRIDPIAGDDIYLTIDAGLQRSVYRLLEKQIASILLLKIRPTMDYGSKGESASEITIPIYEVYNSLINNNIIDYKHFDDKDATDLEHRVYEKYRNSLLNVFKNYDTFLDINNTVTNNKAGDMEEFLDYFYQALVDQHILLVKSIPVDDTTFQAYKNDSTSLSSFLKYAIANNWVDLSKLSVGDKYNTVEELYNKLIKYIKNILDDDDKFNKKIYRNLVFSYKLTGTEISLLLFDQGVLEYDHNKSNVNGLNSGTLSAYNFITDKIKSLEITPAMLALEPCSGSVVITDVNTGDVLALVTYPGYDNNLFANKVNSAYFNKLMDDKSFPLLNLPVMQKTAPGSTFKMITSFAALEEGVTTPYETVSDKGIFTKIEPAAKCHIYPGSHGNVNIVDALKVSCNYYFYEMGWRMSIDNFGRFNEQLGLSKLKKYAAMFGLDSKSGIELYEAAPEISSSDSVRSSIGQGSNDYTPIQLSRYITTLANSGTNYDLTLLDKVVDKDGTVILNNSAKVVNDLTGAKESTWNSIREGMYSVVNTPGGSAYSIFKNLGVTVAGKTGTAQLSRSQPNHALFVSYAPFNAPEISVTTVIPYGYTSLYAATLAKDIYKVYFNLEDQDSVVNSDVSVTESSNIDSYTE
jgi:penicillin-binding protein 2